jgi:hypothetical protein
MNIQELIDAVKRMKEECCLREKGPCDVSSLIHVEVGEQRPVLIPVVGVNDPMESLQTTLGVLLSYFKSTNKGYKFDQIAYISEGYFRVTSELPQNYKRGEMENEYNNDPTSDICQCLMINIFRWDCSSEMAVIKYGYDDYGKPLFESYDTNRIAAGNVLDIMRKFRAFCKFQEDGLVFDV